MKDAHQSKAGRSTLRLPCAMIAFALMGSGPLPALAHDGQSHDEQAHGQSQAEMTPDQKRRASALLRVVRESTARFQNVAQAEAEGYALQFGCVSGDYTGAMGLHYVNGELVGKGVIDATRPQIVIYEPTASGRLRLTGADFLVLADQWNATHTSPPELMGQLFHLFDAPNRFGLPPFYTLHVWAWKDNPNGAFVNWHPNVSCEQFNGDSAR